MKPYKSLTIANEVLNGLIDSGKLQNCTYHSFYSGGVDANGFCGYTIYGVHEKKTIKITFYGINKLTDIPIHIFVLVNGKSRTNNKQFSVKDAVKFIVDKVHNL